MGTLRTARAMAVFAGLCIGTAAVAGPPASTAPALDDLTLLDALSWGPSVSGAAELRRLGRQRWLAEQLHPATAQLPDPVEAQIAALPGAGKPLIAIVSELEGQNRAAAAMTDPEARKAAQQSYQSALNDIVRGSAARTILQALYGPDQLRQKMSWFWFNRFNVHAGKANLRAMVGDYMDRAIRPHALGRFRDLLGATLKHPAMLRYLDNAENAAGRLNENYARELMELHTMGVGSGYAQADVEALARILTGVGIDTRSDDPKLKPEWQGQIVRDGLFLFNPARHDYSEKVFLGHRIAGSGFGEVEAALDILSRHPATARNVSRALATYFAGDAPPEALVARMADTFTRTDGDVAAVLSTLFGAPEFPVARERHVKDPVAFVFSALRLAYDDRVILSTAPVQGWLNRLAEGLFNHGTPDGYALSAGAWTGPGQLTTRFEVARQIGGGSAGLFRPPGADAADRPAFPLFQNALFFESWRHRLTPATRAALDQAVSPQDWNTLFLSSPEFMR